MVELDKNYSSLWVKVSKGEEQGSGGSLNGDPEGDFRKRWQWYCTIDEITMGDCFKEDELFSWSCVRFLNRIAYLKEKNFIISQSGR